MKPIGPNTDQRLRSLLQKAVRRGYVDLVEQVASLLYSKRETSWLRSRTVVITYEECWPSALRLALDTSFSSKLYSLKSVSLTRKDKSAAGLGTLAYALSQGDSSVLYGGDDDRHIKIVAEAIHRPDDFWGWARQQAHSSEQLRYTETTHRYMPSPTWPWDKAFLQAGAYLAVTEGIPYLESTPVATGNFPFWVALDKHTPQGKTALKAVVKKLNCTYRQLLWTSFYFESAQTNLHIDSHWWNREMEWRLGKTGLTCDSAINLWHKASPLVAAELAEEARKLETTVLETIPNPEQHMIF